MTPQEIVDGLVSGQVLMIKEQELVALLDEATLLRQKDTCVNGLIRALEYSGSIIIQEYTNKKEVALRKVASKEAADRFIDDRLNDYERMWDGCGCKIDYYQ